MPFREYECIECGYKVNIYQHSKDIPNPTCIICEQEVEILISKCNFRLRGLGWSSDGYSKDIDDVEQFWAKDGQPVQL